MLGRSLQGFSVASRASGSALSSISAVRTCLCALAYRIYHLPMDPVSVSDPGLRQYYEYEDTNLTPAALSFFENVSRPGLQNRDTSSGQTAPKENWVEGCLATTLG